MLAKIDWKLVRPYKILKNIHSFILAVGISVGPKNASPYLEVVVLLRVAEFS